MRRRRVRVRAKAQAKDKRRAKGKPRGKPKGQAKGKAKAKARARDRPADREGAAVRARDGARPAALAEIAVAPTTTVPDRGRLDQVGAANRSPLKKHVSCLVNCVRDVKRRRSCDGRCRAPVLTLRRWIG